MQHAGPPVWMPGSSPGMTRGGLLPKLSFVIAGPALGLDPRVDPAIQNGAHCEPRTRSGCPRASVPPRPLRHGPFRRRWRQGRFRETGRHTRRARIRPRRPAASAIREDRRLSLAGARGAPRSLGAGDPRTRVANAGRDDQQRRSFDRTRVVIGPNPDGRHLGKDAVRRFDRAEAGRIHRAPRLPSRLVTPRTRPPSRVTLSCSRF
jgi:hypothetical protein